ALVLFTIWFPPEMVPGVLSLSLCRPPGFTDSRKEIVMKNLVTIAAAVCLAAVLSYAENWNGKLIDYACHERAAKAPDPAKNPGATACAASATTTSFGIQL